MIRQCVHHVLVHVFTMSPVYTLLKKMAEDPQRVFNRAQLEDSLYGWGEGAESNTIDVHVHHLRKKLGADVIKTIRGVGYRLGHVAA